MKTLSLRTVLQVGLPGVCLGAALAQTPAQFVAIEPLTNREIRLAWSAPAGVPYRVETSEDLASWDGLITLVSAGSDVHTDSAAPYHAARYYSAVELPETPPLTGDVLATEDGEVVIHPINHASLVLGWKGVTIYVDPVGGAAPYAGLPRADLILVTHGHGDHLHAATLEAVRVPTAVIGAPQVVYNGLSTALRGLTTVLTNGATATLAGVPVSAVPAYNLTASNHPKGVGNGYVLTLGGRRLYVAGDTEDVPELRALTGIDVAFLPMNVPFTMTVAKAVSAVREFRPKVVYPYHYRNQDGSFANLNGFKAQVGTDLGIEVRLRAWY